LERTPLRSRVGRYRGLALQVQAHPLFAPEILLCLPSGDYLDELHARTEAGLFASADSVIRALPERKHEVVESIRTKQQRIVEIDAELERLAVWDGQATYEAAVKELAAIMALFAAQEAEEAPAASASGTTEAIADLSAETIAAVQALTSAADAAEAPLSIPPAVASLDWMEAEVQRRAARNRADLVDDGALHAQEDAVAPTITKRQRAPMPTVVPSNHRPTTQPRPRFGQALPRRSASNRPAPAQAQQRDLFAMLGAEQQTSTPPPAPIAHDHDLAELSQCSLFD
jgi:hypothetical protein